MKAAVTILMLRFGRLRMEEVRGYIEAVVQITNQLPPEQTGESGQGLILSLEAYTEILKQVPASIFTEEVAKADAYRDTIGTGLVKAVDTATYSPDPLVAEAAKKVQIVLKTAKNFTRLPYAQQTATIRDLIENLTSSRYLNFVTTAKVEQWVSALEQANNAFDTVYIDRELVEAEYRLPVGASMEARKNVIAEYNEFMSDLNAMLRLQPTSELESVARSLNELTRRHQHLIAQRLGRKAAKKDTEESHPPRFIPF